jgi:hypothetical protein
MGNKSCFRNEKHNTMSFIMTNDYVLPEGGILEFDFIYLSDRGSVDCKNLTIFSVGLSLNTDKRK